MNIPYCGWDKNIDNNVTAAKEFDFMEIQDKQRLPLYEDDNIFDTDTVASSTEYTELIPTPTISGVEAESYADIYVTPHPDNDEDNGLQHE